MEVEVEVDLLKPSDGLGLPLNISLQFNGTSVHAALQTGQTRFPWSTQEAMHEKWKEWEHSAVKRAWPWFILSKQIEHVTILLLAEDGDGETGRDLLLLTPRWEAFRAFHHDLYPGSTIDDEITGNLNPMYVYIYLYTYIYIS